MKRQKKMSADVVVIVAALKTKKRAPDTTPVTLVDIH